MRKSTDKTGPPFLGDGLMGEPCENCSEQFHLSSLCGICNCCSSCCECDLEERAYREGLDRESEDIDLDDEDFEEEEDASND